MEAALHRFAHDVSARGGGERLEEAAKNFLRDLSW